MKKILIVDDLHENIFPLLAEMNFEVNYQPNIKRPEILEIIKNSSVKDFKSTYPKFSIHLGKKRTVK
jgi:hypothetical protein